ncbi:hypothetical protein ACWEFL_13035 [Streptomyces sp. NPDC004838]
MSDEEWAEFVRRVGNGDGDGDAPKEPSARARMVAARLRDQPQPEGRRTGPAGREADGRARRRRRILGGLGVLAAIGLVVAMRPELVTDRWEAGDVGAKSTTPLAPETARPTTAPAEELFPDTPTLKEPFRGSPAAVWADGAAGIQVPEARAVGGMSKAQVEHALRSTRELLISANLDPATLRGERPAAAFKLIDPLQKDGHGLLERGLRKPSAREDPLWLFSRFDPAEVRVVGDVVKTRGRMAFGESERPGAVRVNTDYTFVYPLARAEPGSEEVTRTIVRRQMTFELYDPAKVVTTPGRLYVTRMDMSSGNAECGKDGEGFLRPQFLADRARSSSGAAGPTVDPYDRSKDLALLPQECGTVTRT